MKRSFEPFDETKDSKYLSWKGEDSTDKFIPNIPGFITDVVYATRGREVASIYAVWGALYMMSSVIQRDAWYTPPEGDDWLDRDYLNLYTLFIGPAGSGKSATITLIQKILTGCNVQFMESTDPYMRRKAFTPVSDVSTPEAFLGQMASHSKGEDGKTRRVIIGKVGEKEEELKAWSNANAMLSEFGALLNKKQYNDSMSTNLLTLYDSPKNFSWSTVKRGMVHIPDVYLNIIGASTADGMTSNVDPKILEDGFMSRVIMCYSSTYSRSRPFRFKTGCSMQTLIKRLMWIAEKNRNTFSLSRASEEWFFTWYEDFMRKMNANPEKAGYMIRNRTSIIKIAILLKISEYGTGHEIDIHHLKAADKLLKQTYDAVSDLIGYFTDAQLGAARRAVESALLRVSGGLTRRMLAQRINRFRSDSIDYAIKDLYLRGQLRVIDDSGDEKGEPKFFPEERYIYERLKFKYDDFEPEVHSASEGSVLERDSSSGDSRGSEQESVGDIPDTPQSWGGYVAGDERPKA